MRIYLDSGNPSLPLVMLICFINKQWLNKTLVGKPY